MEKNRFAFFDFCETLVTIQSADIFIDFVRENTTSYKRSLLEIIRLVIVKLKIRRIINKLFPNNNLHKKLKLYQLKGISRNRIENLSEKYYNEYLQTKLIPEIIDELKQKQKEGYRVVIVSGGYTSYIKYFATTFNIDTNDIIATDISFNGRDICKGVIEGIDCVKQNKIVKLKKSIKDIDSYDLEESFAYSDCITDLTLLKFVGNGIVVNNKEQKWSTENNLKQIIWN